MDDFTGTVMVSLDGPSLTREDRYRLNLPAVGAACLFARNFTTWRNLVKLVKDIRSCVDKPLLLATDQEGGRVQRFKGRGFADLPPARVLGLEYEKNPENALNQALERGALIGRQLSLVDIDLSFVPVLDIDYGRNVVIDSRCLGATPEVVTVLALALCQGLAEQGMQAVGKHFPGHGWAKADSHLDNAVDDRTVAQIMQADVLPYRELCSHGLLGGVMMSHVHYRKMAKGPATYAVGMVGGLLRRKLGFKGKVLTDDLVMQGADCGAMHTRVQQAAAAGCDCFLVVGGEPVLYDSEIAKLAASGTRVSPWLSLVRNR